MSKTTLSELIGAKKLIKTYGKGDTAFSALKGVDLSIKQGEAVAIIGKSGSGKSTLLHLLALLDTPTKGSVSIDGTDMAELKRKEADEIRNNKFGFVFQQFFLNANDSVLNNVVLPLKIGGVSYKERNRRGMEALKSVELSTLSLY